MELFAVLYALCVFAFLFGLFPLAEVPLDFLPVTEYVEQQPGECALGAAGAQDELCIGAFRPEREKWKALHQDTASHRHLCC
jgi:hypothetical protein